MIISVLRFSCSHVHAYMQIYEVLNEDVYRPCERWSSLVAFPVPVVYIHTSKYQKYLSIGDVKRET